MTSRTLTIVHRIYDEAHAALWALLAAGALFFLAVVAPNIPEYRAQAERQRIAEIAAENRSFCEKLGMPAGTQQHTRCTLDVGALRARIARRMADELDGF